MLRVRVNEISCLPITLRGESGPREFEVLESGDLRIIEEYRNRSNDKVRYLLALPDKTGHEAYTTVSAWYVPIADCTVLEQ